MAATTYAIPDGYSISGDFPNHKVATDRLQLEIEQSAIVTALDTINTVGNLCAVIFKAALSVGDVAILDGIVATHSGEPLPLNATPVTLQTATGVAFPTVSDIPVMLPNLFPIGVVLDIAGAGDSVANGRGEGAQFAVTAPANGADISVEWQFNDWIVMAGGGMNYAGAQLGDHATMTVIAPATPVTASGGGNTGNCNLVDPGVGAAILIVPAAGNGTHNVDLSTAIPVPALGAGYYSCTDPDFGLGVITAGAPGTSAYNLFTVAIPLTKYATKFQLLGDRSINLTLPAVKPGNILPQWKGKVVLHTAETLSQAKLCWFLITARMRTV